MATFLDLYSPATHDAFTRSAQDVTGFRPRHRHAAERVSTGDHLLCYLTKLSRWVGLLEVLDGPYEDAKPIFSTENDPFVIRFKVRPLVWLPPEQGVPIKHPSVWSKLSFTREHELGSVTWTGKVRSSLCAIDPADASFLEKKLQQQAGSKATSYPLTDAERKQLVTHEARRSDGTVVVTVPEDTPEEAIVPPADARESIKIQAALAKLGAKMGMRVWLPRNDRSRILEVWKEDNGALIEHLPLNYDNTTLQTIENIDVLWLRGRSMARAFEVEHTTAIYSGILRMADLLALQPNMDIRLHIVAPEARKQKVFVEIRRPVFSLLEGKPLAERCTFLSYDAVNEIAALKHLGHLSDSVLEEYSEEAEG